jgi:hypothetical protein
VSIFDFLKRGPSKKTCAQCAQRAAHGYSRAAESHSSQIAPLCLSCLTERLRHDYEDFRGRAVVIAPAQGLPCYVFRDREFVRSVSVDVERELDTSFQEIGPCSDCTMPGRCLWIESQGVTLEAFGDVLEKGLRTTVLSWGNPAPRSLCGKCVVERIAKSLRADGFEFFEICAPHGANDGLVIPMAY